MQYVTVETKSCFVHVLNFETKGLVQQSLRLTIDNVGVKGWYHTLLLDILSDGERKPTRVTL
jgi:hypothetical protein